MSITQVIENDINALLSIATKVVNHSVNVQPEEKQNIINGIHSNIKTWWNLDNCVFLKYEDNNKIVGFILIKEYWNFSDIFVLPSKQRKGIGNKLAQNALLICKGSTSKSSIRVNSSLNAVSFYKKLGFVTVKIKNEIPTYVIPLEFTF